MGKHFLMALAIGCIVDTRKGYMVMGFTKYPGVVHFHILCRQYDASNDILLRKLAQLWHSKMDHISNTRSKF